MDGSAEKTAAPSGVASPAPRLGAAAMPLVAAWVDGVRKRLGRAYVNDMIRRAMAGERNCFYACEGGRFMGAPFDWTAQGQMLVSMSVLTGEAFIAAIREVDGTVLVGRAPAAPLALVAAGREVAHGAH